MSTNKTTNRLILLAIPAFVLAVVVGAMVVSMNRNGPTTFEDGRVGVPVTFTGGHETKPIDKGRPVVLIAGALGVDASVFRDAFSRVKPSPAGTAPSQDRVHKNKEVLMKALSPHGITNDRLDTVSNYYRYNRNRGEMWPTQSPRVYAIIENGKVVGFKVEQGGSGFSSPPTISVPGHPDVRAQMTLQYGEQFESNGSIQSVELVTE